MRVALCIGAGASALFQSAHAQSQRPEARADVRVTATDAYEDNVLRIGDTQPTPNGFFRSDYRFTPSLTFDIVRPLGPHDAFLRGNIGYDFYRRNKRLERERLNLIGGGDLRYAGCAQHVQAGISRQQSDLRDFSSLVAINNAEERVSYSVGIDCGRAIGLKPGLTFDHEKTTNSQIRRQTSDFSSNTFGASLGYVSPTLGELSLYGSYRKGKYPKRPVLPQFGVSDSIEVFNGGVRFSRSIGARLRGTLALGYVKVDPGLGAVRSFGGPSYSTDLNWQPNDKFATQIRLSRAASQSNQLNVSYSIDDSVSVINTFALNNWVKARFGGSLLKRRFRDSPAAGPNLLGNEDRSRQFQAGLDLSPRGRFGWSFDFIGARRSAAVNRFDYNYSIASLTLRVGL